MVRRRRLAIVLLLLLLAPLVCLPEGLRPPGAPAPRIARDAPAPPAAPGALAVHQVAMAAPPARPRRRAGVPRFAPHEVRSRPLPPAEPAPPRIPLAAADTAPAGPEPILIELRLGDIVRRTVPAWRVGDDVLLPLTDFFELAGIEARFAPGGAVDAVLQPGAVPLRFDPARDTAFAGTTARPIGDAERLLDGGVLYVATAPLGELLGIRFTVDWPELRVWVRDASRLPVAQRARREAARAALLRRREQSALFVPVRDGRAPLGGFVLDYSWFSPSDDPVGGGAFAGSVGADLFGGSLELGARSRGRIEDDDVRYDGAWHGVWPGAPVVKQLRLGDGQMSGPRGRPAQGVLLTNSPYARPSLLGAMPFTGQLPPGWEVEAYRNGQLVAVDSTSGDGLFGVELPVLYGENPVEFVAYGPHGEVQRFQQTYRVDGELLPAGRFEYGLSGGRCRDFACAALGNADLRWGAARRWTLRAGVDRIWRDSLADLWHPYVGVTGSLTNAWAVQLDAALDAVVRTGLRYEPDAGTRISAEYAWYDAASRSPLVDYPDRTGRATLYAFYRPDAAGGRFYLEGSAERLTGGAGVLDRVRGAASFQLGLARLMPYVRLEHDGAAHATRSFTGTDAFVVPPRTLGPLLRPMWFRGTLELEDASRVLRASLTAARPVARGVRAEAAVEWAHGAGGPAFSFALSSDFSTMRARTAVTAPSGGPAVASQLVQGSVLYDRRHGGVELAAGPALQRAGVAGRVFLDANGNRRFDPGESGVTNVRVRVASASGVSDTTGAYRVWDVLPFEPVDVQVDSLSFESPLWVAVEPQVRVIPAPNTYTTVDLPLAVGGVVEGRVVREFGGELQGMAGIPLILTSVATGRRRRITTFSDGGFYALGVLPGAWRLEVDQAALRLLRLEAAPLALDVPPGDGSLLDPVELRLAPAR